MIKVNGVEMSSLVDYGHDIMDVTNAERDVKAYMHIDLIAKKNKLSLSFGVLTQSEMKNILSTLEKKMDIEVEFIDPATGNYKKSTFYRSDRSLKLLTMINGEPIWKSLTVNLIEN